MKTEIMMKIYFFGFGFGRKIRCRFTSFWSLEHAPRVYFSPA